LALLQSDTTEDNPHINFPEKLCILEEVAEDMEYQSESLARKKTKDKQIQKIFL